MNEKIHIQLCRTRLTIPCTTKPKCPTVPKFQSQGENHGNSKMIRKLTMAMTHIFQSCLLKYLKLYQTMKRKSDSSRKVALARYYEKKKKRKNNTKERNEIMCKQELNRQYKRKSREKKKKIEENIT